MRVGEALSGVPANQNEIEIATGQGMGDCGFAFQPGEEYVVYAHRNAEGRLETGICSGTRPVDQAAGDLAYFRAMAGAPATGELRVRAGLPGTGVRAAVTVVAEREGSRYRAVTDGGGLARVSGLPPGEYRVHIEADGDLPDDPRVQVNAKGCQEAIVFRSLYVTGRATTREGAPARRVEIQARSLESRLGDAGTMTDGDGNYELRIMRPGRYQVGVNLQRTATSAMPYPRWFHPGTGDPALATIIEFTGQHEVLHRDFALPERQERRRIEGVVLWPDGRPQPQARLFALDSSFSPVEQGAADENGRFRMDLFVATPYRLYALWLGEHSKAVSAAPLEVQPGREPLMVRLVLSEQGNRISEDRERASRGR